MAALLVLLVFLLCVILTVPIGVSMVMGAAAPILLLDKGGSIAQVLNNTFSGANSTPILAVPLFILGGVIMAEGGISRRLFNFFAYFVGRLPGGLPCACILTCLFYGAISGSGPATTAAVGSMCIPFLAELGYDRRWSAGLVSVAGGLGVIIPPSIPFVLYSLATGVSTGELFLGGVLPGILIGLLMMVYAVVHCVRNGETAIVVMYDDLDCCFSDCAGRDERIAVITELQNKKTAMEEEIRKNEPHLAATDDLFGEFRTWDYASSSNPHYRKLCRKLDKELKALTQGSKLEYIRRAGNADICFLAVPEKLVDPAVIPIEWGIVELTAKPRGFKLLRPAMQLPEVTLEGRLQLALNIASSASGPVCFANGVDANGKMRRPPKKRRR